MFKRILILVALATPAMAQNTQTGDLNTNTQDSTVDSNNPSTTNHYNGADSASDVNPPPTAVAPSVPSGGRDSCPSGRSHGPHNNDSGVSFSGYVQNKA